MRSVVVLPQPDGPRSVANDPFGTSKDTSSTAVTPPKRLVTCDTRTCAVWTLGSGTCGPERDAAPCHEREEQERDDRHPDVGDRVCGRGAPVEVADELVDADRRDGRGRREEE